LQIEERRDTTASLEWAPVQPQREEERGIDWGLQDLFKRNPGAPWDRFPGKRVNNSAADSKALSTGARPHAASQGFRVIDHPLKIDYDRGFVANDPGIVT
jgi:hypothetical protein